MRGIVVFCLVLCALVGVLLLALSLVPGAQLAGRLLGAAGQSRTGANTQELLAYLDQRLRLAGGLLLVLVAALAVTREAVEDLIAAAARELALPRLRMPTALLVGAVSLAGLAIRIPFLTQPMRYDEALTFNEFASRPLYYGLSYYPDPNNHLLNTLLMHVSFVVFGNQPWALRLPALLAGVLLVPATFALARHLYSENAAVLAATLAAVGSYLVEYSTNARGYTLQALAFVLALWLVVRAVRRNSRGGLLIGALVCALGAYALPTMLYGVAIAAIWALLQRRFALKYLLASGFVLGLVVALLYVPVLVISGADKLVGNRFVVPLGIGELGPELLGSLARTWAFWNRDVPWPLAALLVIGFGITVAFEARARQIPLGLLAPLVCLVLVLLQRVAPFERVWLFLLPLYYVIASAGLTCVSSPGAHPGSPARQTRHVRFVPMVYLVRFFDGRVLAALFGVVLGFLTLSSGSILASNETGAFPDAEAVARTLAPRLAPDDAVVTQLPASLPELQYYFPRYGLSTAPLVRPPEEGQNLWVLAPPDSQPREPGFPVAQQVDRFDGAMLWVLKRS